MKKRNWKLYGSWFRRIQTYNSLLVSSVGTIFFREIVLEEKLVESSADYGGNNAHGYGPSPSRSNF